MHDFWSSICVNQEIIRVNCILFLTQNSEILIYAFITQPMAEIEGMTDAQIEAAIKEMESQIRRERNEFTNAKR